MRKVLMIAFHYPPCAGGSGIHRTLKFARYLPEYGWQPTVLTAHSRAYSNVEGSGEILPKVVVERAFAFDTARQFSIRGRYSRIMALPDPWVSWWVGAIWSGLRLIRKYRPDVLWSTYPIATAHLIGFTLHRVTGLPWVVDFRDSMTEQNYPRDEWVRASYLWVEKRTIRFGSRLVFTAPSSLEMYCNRYPALPAKRCILIPNGYDEEDFVELSASKTKKLVDGRAVRILHAGLIYPDDRDPRAFFSALSRLKAEGKICRTTLSIDLRASGSEAYYTNLIAQLRIDDIVRLLPALPHRKALEDCGDADALLLFQAASCNHQIPAKVYEYLRLRKPILALTSPEGDTAALLNRVRGATIIDLADEAGQYRWIPEFLNSIRNGTHELPDPGQVDGYARRHQSFQLAECLSESVSSE